jgi:hypothetical protein
LQLFGAVQSSQIGPHLVQPFSSTPSAITPQSTFNRLAMFAPFNALHHKDGNAAISSRATA